MDVNIKINGNIVWDTLSWDDIRAIEDGDMVHAKEAVAKFVVTAGGTPIPYARAMKQLGVLSWNESMKIVLEFQKLLHEALENPTTGDGSSEPSPKVEAPLSGGSSSLPPVSGDVSPGS